MVTNPADGMPAAPIDAAVAVTLKIPENRQLDSAMQTNSFSSHLPNSYQFSKRKPNIT